MRCSGHSPEREGGLARLARAGAPALLAAIVAPALLAAIVVAACGGAGGRVGGDRPPPPGATRGAAAPPALELALPEVLGDATGTARAERAVRVVRVARVAGGRLRLRLVEEADALAHLDALTVAGARVAGLAALDAAGDGARLVVRGGAPVELELPVALPDGPARVPIVVTGYRIALGPLRCQPPGTCGRAPAPAAVDLHVDLLFQLHFRRQRAGTTQVRPDAPGLAGLVLSVYLPGPLRPGPTDASPLPALLEAARRLRAVVPPGVETWLSFEGRPPDVDRLLAEGVRVLGLAHAWHSDLADSATDPRPGRGGLTAEGEAAVRRILAAGALIDVAHLSDEAFDDVARLAREAGAPLVATHTAARALAPHRRNLDDERLREVARSGGVVGVTLHAPHLRRDGAAATSADWAAHVEHIVSVAGLAHVALGSDLDGNLVPPADVPDSTALPALARALAARGFSDETLARVLADNARALLGAPSRAAFPP